MDDLSAAEDPEFVPRSYEHLSKYSLEYRWEFTRRHPYYLALWQIVADYHRTFSPEGESDFGIGFAAKLALGAIGVGGEPVSPALPFAELAGTDPNFLYGSVQPLTLRGIIPLLLTTLSSDNQEFLADILLNNVENLAAAHLTPEMRRANTVALAGHVALRPDPNLDDVPDKPLFYFHLEASQETLKEDANRQARLWKERRGLSSPKVHTNKLKEYLEVWDRVEGWTGDGYDVGRENAFQAAVATAKKSLSTLHDQYRAAFRAIFGQDFTADRWWKTMGRLKLTQFTGEAVQSQVWLARHRLMYTRRDHPAVAAAPAPPPDATTGPVSPDSAEGNLYAEIRRLICDGAPDDHILEELGLTDPRSSQLLAYVRAKESTLGPL